ncbi:MAG: hypothetical protein KIG13_02065, partial [Eubacteriales bacterium]|nr:hypothetical protein [Eubacteriales bacterium]
EYITVTNDGKITINKNAKTSGQNIYVSVDIKIVGTDIILGSYNLILSPTKVLSVSFPGTESANPSEITITIPDTALPSTPSESNIFNLDDGYVQVEMKQNTYNFGKVSFEVFAKQKYSYFTTGELKPVTVYALGGTKAQFAKLFILDNPAGGVTSTIATVGGEDAVSKVLSRNILGQDNDDEICTVSGGSIVFTKEGIWPIEVVTASGTNTYYVRVVKNGSSYDATYYNAITDAGKLALESIFGNISNEDMYEFYVSSVSQNTIGLEAIQGLDVIQPSSNITFTYTFGRETYVIPFAVGVEKFNENGNPLKPLKDLKYANEYKNEKTLRISNEYGTDVGTYAYTLVRDFKFDDTLIENVKIENKKPTLPSSLNSYNENEFDSYNNDTYKFTKTIELIAGTSYDLVRDILITELGMTKFDLTPYEKTLTLELKFGNYVSNSNFTTNMSGLLVIVEKEKDGSRIVNYEIVPRGAQNGGDIIHLKLAIGGADSNDVYYLRIKIIPNVKIQSLSVSGDKIINCEEGAQGEASITRVYLSDLIQVENINDVSQLTASVVSNDSAGYVLGLGTNCIEEFNNGKTGLEAYGLRLKATNLGGAQIKIIIRDKFGYQVTDSSGEPITITLHYKKTDGTSVELNKSNSSSEIYEGDTFSIWAVAYDEKNNKDVYARYIGDGNWEGEQDEQDFNNYWNGDNTDKQLILLDNITFDHDANDNLTQPRATVSISQSAELTTINSGILNGMTINYVSNTNFTEEKISGNNFVVRVSDNTETISFSLSTTIKQRYK